MNHFLVRYSDLIASTVSTLVVTPPTNYVSLSTTLTEAADDSRLTYQWYKNAKTNNPIAGATDSTLIVGPLQLSNTANYHYVVTNLTNHTTNNPLTFLTNIPIPTNTSN